MSTLAFLIFGVLLARNLSTEPEAMVMLGLAAAIGGWLAARLLRVLLVHPIGATDRARVDADRNVDAALAVLLPFALLAALAQFGLAWEAALAFLVSGLGGSAASAASCAIRHGAPPGSSVLVAALWSMLLGCAWTLAWSVEWLPA